MVSGNTCLSPIIRTDVSFLTRGTGLAPDHCKNDFHRFVLFQNQGVPPGTDRSLVLRESGLGFIPGLVCHWELTPNVPRLDYQRLTLPPPVGCAILCLQDSVKKNSIKEPFLSLQKGRQQISYDLTIMISSPRQIYIRILVARNIVLDAGVAINNQRTLSNQGTELTPNHRNLSQFGNLTCYSLLVLFHHTSSNPDPKYFFWIWFKRKFFCLA